MRVLYGFLPYGSSKRNVFVMRLGSTRCPDLLRSCMLNQDFCFALAHPTPPAAHLGMLLAGEGEDAVHACRWQRQRQGCGEHGRQTSVDIGMRAQLSSLA